MPRQSGMNRILLLMSTRISPCLARTSCMIIRSVAMLLKHAMHKRQ